MSDNLSRQVEEIEALCSIYGKEWKTEDEVSRSYSIHIKEDRSSVTLYIVLPKDYPSDCPPTYQLFAPELNIKSKQQISWGLDEVYLENIGETVIFQWIEKIREVLRVETVLSEETNPEEQAVSLESYEDVTPFDYKLPEICHGEVIIDRKSVFQGHAVSVVSIEQIKQVILKLHENKKIANATHNMYAYRIYKEDSKCYIQDCEDDGESQAGGRMLHLLQILDVKNVLVVVTRWYGGVHLGPDRFRHINNATRQVLDKAGLIPRNEHRVKKK